MKKSWTNAWIGAAVGVAAASVAGGAIASASSLPEKPAPVASSIVQLNDDGSAVECTLTGDAATAFLGELPEMPEGESGTLTAPEGAQGSGGVTAFPEPMPLPDDAKDGDAPVEVHVGDVGEGNVVVGQVKVGDANADELEAGARTIHVTDGDVRQGTEDECAKILADVAVDETTKAEAGAKQR